VNYSSRLSATAEAGCRGGKEDTLKTEIFLVPP
jgi:hypothetical protein